MAFFDFIENFFFISLGITFTLILLLVYHFKQRITTMERKGDTMYELMTNIVKELQIMKKLNAYYESLFSGTSLSDEEPDELSTIKNSLPSNTSAIPPSQEQNIDTSVCLDTDVRGLSSEALSEALSDSFPSKINVHNKIVVSDEEDDDEDDETSSGCSEYSDADDEEEKDDEEDNDNEEELLIQQLDVENVLTSDNEILIDIIEIETFNEEDLLSNDKPEADRITYEDKSSTSALLSTSLEATPSISYTDNLDASFNSVTEEDIASKTNETAEKKQTREVYRKMNITQLRSIATISGITHDTSKMKKNELIQLLENLEE